MGDELEHFLVRLSQDLFDKTPHEDSRVLHFIEV